MVILEKHFPSIRFVSVLIEESALLATYYQNQLYLQFLFIATKGALIQVLCAM